MNNGSENMITNHASTVLSIMGILGVLAGPASAADTVEIPAVASPGNAAEANAILGAKLLICNTCHGPDGVPRSSAPTPIIWGQQENYLVKQMHDFQHGDRDSEVMKWMATALSQPEVGSAAAYFSKKKWPEKKAAAAPASPPDAVAVCEACHQEKFAGGVAAPRLAGQSYEYLVEAMRRYADGERSNNTDMMRIMEAIPADEREAIARYISSL